MRDWHIIVVAVVLIVAGWLLRSQPDSTSNTVSFAGWIIAIGLVMFSISLYNILKVKK